MILDTELYNLVSKIVGLVIQKLNSNPERDLEMRVLGEAKKSRLTMCTFSSSFGCTMECTRTIAILIKVVKKDIIPQRWKFRSFTSVLLRFAPSLRS